MLKPAPPVPVMPTSSNNSIRVLEICAVVITAIGKFVFMDCLNLKLAFITTAIIIWTGYVVYRINKNPAIAKQWGFRKDNFAKTVRLILPFAVVAIVLFLIIGLFRHTINISWHILPILILYPIWGTIQQFLLIGLIVGNLTDSQIGRMSKSISIVLAALVFGGIHYPFVWLMVGTFVLALFYGAVYLKERNLYALGVFHGWLAAFFFYMVVGRDPFLETFGSFLHISR
jgi:hypothetical protein